MSGCHHPITYPQMSTKFYIAVRELSECESYNDASEIIKRWGEVLEGKERLEFLSDASIYAETLKDL